MKVYLTRRYHFPASHRLHSDTMSAEDNAKTFGKCNNPHGHGHNYGLEVTVAGPIDTRTGMVCDLSALDDAVNRAVLERYDHANLNVLEEFSAKVPTTENLGKEIYRRLQDFKPAKIVWIRLEETAKNSFEYAGGAEIAH